MARTPVRRTEIRRRHPLLLLLALAAVACACWFAYVYVRIEQVSQHDDARPASAIAVFGAAQYRGHPSPVYHARLDHAAYLFERQLAPLIITLGGSADGFTGDSEGSVGRDYLLARGVPYSDIVAETESTDTEQQVQILAEIARGRHLDSIIVVSDGTHLFRILELCREQGLTVYASPRPAYGNVSDWNYSMRVVHEMMGYTLLRMHVDAGWLHHWFEGREDL